MYSDHNHVHVLYMICSVMLSNNKLGLHMGSVPEGRGGECRCVQRMHVHVGVPARVVSRF